jgi:hypothetical protein
MAASRKKSSSSSSTDGLECPACGRAHDSDVRFCRDCGMPLVIGGELSEEPAASDAHERARKIRPEYTHGELVRVAGARHQAEAEFIQNLLLEEGIPSIFRRSIGFDVPDFLAAGWRDVLVPESGAEAARDVLTEADIAPAAGSREGPRVSRLVLWIVVGLLIGAALLWLALGSPR